MSRASRVPDGDRRVRPAFVVACLLGLAVALPGQEPGPDFVPIVMVVGCVDADAQTGFFVSRATDPVAIDDRLPEEPDPSTPLGDGRVRLIGTLDEFGVPDLLGHKVRARGLPVEDADEVRLNLTSILSLAPSCS